MGFIPGLINTRSSGLNPISSDIRLVSMLVVVQFLIIRSNMQWGFQEWNKGEASSNLVK